MNILTKPPVMAGVTVIDADTHIAEVYDLWTSRAPAAYKARVPQVKEVDGELIWVIDGDKRMGPAFAISTIRRDGSKGHGNALTKWKFEEVFEGAYDVKARLAYMDESGIAAQIAYPNLLGFGNQKSMGVDPDLRWVTTQIYNDAMIEYQKASGDRIFPMALMPWWDIKQSLAEAERCQKAGLRGVNTNSVPEGQGMPVLGDKHWFPLWELCSDLGLPVNFHIGSGFESTAWFGSGVWPTHETEGKMAFGGSMMFVSNYQILANIILSRFLEKFPKLNIVSVESGVGWIPFMLESLEYHMKDSGIKCELTPIELFRRQIYACSWFERRGLAQSARALGVDNVMFETDFPHPVCLYPDPVNFMAETAAEFTHEERRKIFGGNAARVYNIPVS
ncbi:amidohydrolase family protein [Phenylobacterium sp.]|uniref:amidohydrolase family protein n=1 Tax=Phenylobacterium sp. TaxID=1871053 RepID=UPI002F42E3C7